MTRVLLSLTLLGLITFSSFGGEGDTTLLLKPRISKYSYDAIPKDPLASAFFSATIPGSGQIYNKEYLRGIITAIGFYAGLFTAQYYLDRWDALNTDTIYFQETDKYGDEVGKGVRSVYVARADDNLLGLPTGEKVALGVSAAMVAGFWVWGVIDSYSGAKRYNQKLFAEKEEKLSVKMACLQGKNLVGLNAQYKF